MKFKNYIETESGIKDTSTSPGAAGQVLSSTVAGTSWIDQNTISSGTSESVDLLVKNISAANGGVNLVKGDPIYIYGDVGASPRLYVDLADADSTATNNLGDDKMPVVGLLDQDLSPNGEGTATVVGKLRNLITSPIDGVTPWENATLYVKVGGGLTLYKPTGPDNLIQNVGQVGRISTSNDGNIVVAALLRSNDVPNLPEGRIWIGDGNTIVSDTVYVDEPNGRVGIGTTSPLGAIQIGDGTAASPSTNQILVLSNTATTGGNSNLFLATGASGSAVLGMGRTQFAVQNTAGKITYSDIVDTFSFDTNFSTKMVINGSGNVGIGTTSPGTYKLAVAGSTNIGGNVEVSDGLGADVVFSLTPNTGSFKIGDIDGIGDEAYIEGDSSSIKIFTGGAGLVETLVCDISQNVRIATAISSTPTGGYPNVGAGRLVVGGSNFVGAEQPGVITLINQDTTIGAGQDLGVLQFVGKDDASSGYCSSQIIGTAFNAPSSGNSGGGILRFLTNPGGTGVGNTEKMRILSSGNVGIGTTNPSAKLDVVQATSANGAAALHLIGPNTNAGLTSSVLIIEQGDGKKITMDGNDIDVSSGDLFINDYSLEDVTFGGQIKVKGSGSPVGNSYIANGNFGIGTTSPAQKLHVVGRVASTAGNGFEIINSYGSPRLSDFYGSFYTSSQFYVGSPYAGQACYASAFNITSDYRLKENEAPLTEAFSRIKKLKPIRFNYISSENTVDGFLAHEVAEVIPEAVTGEKDAVREDGSDELQGLDLSKIVPLLTAALQKSITKIEQLEQRIQTLENK